VVWAGENECEGSLEDIECPRNLVLDRRLRQIGALRGLLNKLDDEQKNVQKLRRRSFCEVIEDLGVRDHAGGPGRGGLEKVGPKLFGTANIAAQEGEKFVVGAGESRGRRGGSTPMSRGQWRNVVRIQVVQA
jgi:hypothetical protein